MTTNQAGTTVITGATGFVGGELLVKLLQETERDIVCSVRATSAAAATDRGMARLRQLLGRDDAERYAYRVSWVRSDIGEPHLGWGAMRWRDIAAKTTEIFHCAASVSFDLPLDRAQRINVEGTKHVFALAKAAAAAHGNFHRFHHVSTAYVAGQRTGRVGPHTLPADRSWNFRNTYERTKARAERYLRSVASNDVPVSIHRPSIIAGERRTGRTTNWNVLYVPMKLVAQGRLPLCPHGGRGLIDTVAVDYLVDAMLAFSELDEGPLRAHHLTAGPTAFTIEDLVTVTAHAAGRHDEYEASQTRLVGRAAWAVVQVAVRTSNRLPKRMKRVRVQARVAKRVLEQGKDYVGYAYVDVEFDNSRSQQQLHDRGIEMPAGQEYLRTIIDYALATRFGRRIEPSRAVAAA